MENIADHIFHVYARQKFDFWAFIQTEIHCNIRPDHIHKVINSKTSLSTFGVEQVNAIRTERHTSEAKLIDSSNNDWVEYLYAPPWENWNVGCSLT